MHRKNTTLRITLEKCQKMQQIQCKFSHETGILRRKTRKQRDRSCSLF